MERRFTQEGMTSEIVYGETLNRAIDTEKIAGIHVIILTNQRYYDRSFEKISQLFAAADDLDWYICSNSLHCNNVKEMMTLLDFLERFPRNQDYLFVAYGNEGIMELTGFVAEATVFTSQFWCLPVSLRSFAKSLVVKRRILRKDDQTLLQTKLLPEAVYFDQTISEAQNEGKLVDLLALIRCGIVCDYRFLQSLYQNYPDRERIFDRSFAALLPQLMDYYETSGEELEEFGLIFQQAFYQTEQGHLLSANMKRFFATLFHFIWNQVVSGNDFHMKNFCIWLYRCGLPLFLPEQISLNDYGLQVLALAEKAPPLPVYREPGKFSETKVPTGEELVATAEIYQQIIKEIRGTQHV